MQPAPSNSLSSSHSRQLTRRQGLQLLLGAGLAPWSALAGAAAPQPSALLTAWQTDLEQYLGLIDLSAPDWRVRKRLKLPTRAHGLVSEANGHVIAVARRPGDWLLRWHPQDGSAQWQWIEVDRRFNGHALQHGGAPVLFTTETDQQSGNGMLAVRDLTRLNKMDEWPSHGLDPHEMLRLPQAVSGFPAGTLLVANGGIPTRAETGRSKQLDGMDASLVALDPDNGHLLGQWRLDDPRLSIRHLAWDPVSRSVGIALQAEHSDAAQRLAAPVLAVWNGAQLQATTGPRDTQGYAGDICARPDGGFALSCPRADRILLFDAQARWNGSLRLTDACALAASPDGWCASGRSDIVRVRASAAQRADEPRQQTVLEAGWRFENHGLWMA